MPELPEVETVCRGLAAVLDGQIIADLILRRADMRFPFPLGLAGRVIGQRITAVRRRAKYILVELEDGGTLIGHLGMSGRMVIGDATRMSPSTHDHVILVTAHGTAILFNDPRRFGFLDFAEAGGLDSHKMLVHLGPEPLSDAFDGAVLAKRLNGRITPIKIALLDQTVVAGVGNIYASEALFQAGLSPRRKASQITGGRAEKLSIAIKDVLTRAIAAGGSSLRDYVQTSGQLGYFQHQWAVYGREDERCRDCTCVGKIRKIVQGGRATYYCPARQR